MPTGPPEQPHERPRTVRVVAAGDISCSPGMPVTPTQCQQAATAALARRMRPNLVLTLGDHQYENNSLAEYRDSYAKSWGTLRPITRPALGNHEYYTAGATGYYSYFRNRQPVSGLLPGAHGAVADLRAQRQLRQGQLRRRPPG